MSIVELSFFCQNLTDYILIIVEDEKTGVEVGRTNFGNFFEKKFYFDTSLFLPFVFEKQQILKFRIQNQAKEIASISLLLSDIIVTCAQGKFFEIVSDKKKHSNLFIFAEEVRIISDATRVPEFERTRGRSQIKELLVSTPKTITQKILRISFSVSEIDYDEVWIFKSFETYDIMTYRLKQLKVLELQKVNNNRPEQKLKIQFFKDSTPVHQIITSTRDMKARTVPNIENFVMRSETMQIPNPHYEELVAIAENAKRKQYKEYKSPYGFLDYLTSGVQLDLMIAIDFTISNGFPNRDTSLHYIDTDNQVDNEYVKAINTVGRILEYYDHDHLFSVYGFGGVYKDKPSHCFPLEEKPCNGIDEVIEAYKKGINTFSLSAPSNFAEIIRTAKDFARTTINQGNNGYYILLIITDGEISDLKKTKLEIIGASDLPLSIVIVGVGNSNFTSMKELDADIHPLQVDDMVSDRDIVQFVKFTSDSDLSSETLKEIPDQVVSYFAKKKIIPKKFQK